MSNENSKNNSATSRNKGAETRKNLNYGWRLESCDPYTTTMVGDAYWHIHSQKRWRKQKDAIIPFYYYSPITYEKCLALYEVEKTLYRNYKWRLRHKDGTIIPMELIYAEHR